MSKLMLLCDCGQEMTVPESALGRRGLCPECGKELLIGDKNTVPWQPRARTPSAPRPAAAPPPEQAWRRFAEAVDLYSAKRFAEALAVLNQLRIEFPEDQNILDAQRQCLDALERGASSPTPLPDAPEAAELSPDLVRKVILEKMLRGGTESIQLQAAELAARLLGMFPPPQGLLLDQQPSPVMLPVQAPGNFALLPERLTKETTAQPPMASDEEVRQLSEMLDAISGLHHPRPGGTGASEAASAADGSEDNTAPAPKKAPAAANGARRARRAARSPRRNTDADRL